MTGPVSPNFSVPETGRIGKFHRGSRDLGPRMSIPDLKHKNMFFGSFFVVGWVVGGAPGGAHLVLC